jgi:hypothetical protein
MTRCVFCAAEIFGRRYRVQTQYEVGWACSRSCQARAERGEVLVRPIESSVAARQLNELFAAFA